MIQKSKNTIATIIKEYKKYHKIEDLRKLGRKKTTIRIDRKILKKVEENRGISAPKIAVDIEVVHGIRVHPQTIRNRLKSQGFAGRVAVKKPWLSE